MSDDDPTIIQMANGPDEFKIVLASHEARIKELEGKVADNNAVLRPVRWVFNRVIAGLGSAVALIAAVWAAGFLD